MSAALPYPAPAWEELLEQTRGWIDTGGSLRWVLPGHGEPREHCGEIRTWGHKNEGWDWWKHRVSCGRFDCPSCFKDWAGREADRAEERIMLGVGAHLQRVSPGKAARPQCGCARPPKTLDGTVDHRDFVVVGPYCSRRKGGIVHRRWTRGRRSPVHVVVSPPEKLWNMAGDLDGYRALRGIAYDQARTSGLDGALAVFHPYRLGDRWENKRRGLCVPGPHWHFVADAWVTPTRKEDIERGKWVVWNLGIRQSVRGTVFYLLTHAPRAELNRPVDDATTDPRRGNLRETGARPDEGASALEGGPVAPSSLPPHLVSTGPPSGSECSRVQPAGAETPRERAGGSGRERYPRAARSAGTSPNNNLSSGRRPVQTVTWFGKWSYSAMTHPEPAEPGAPVILCPTCKRMVPRIEVCELIPNGGTGPPEACCGHGSDDDFRAGAFVRL